MEHHNNAVNNVPHGVEADASQSSGGKAESLMVKRKRGRPRSEDASPVLAAYSVMPRLPQKRGRGRPRGTGKWQTLAASLGGSVANTTGTDFTPGIITVQEGENIVERIWSFSQRIPESICILSASGTISNAEIYIPAASRTGVLTHKGNFSIVHLNGSHTYDVKRGGKICLLSVELADPEGHLYGGAVARSLIAGGPTQLIIATFRQKLRQQMNVRPVRIDTPKPNKGTVKVPLQGESSEQVDVEPKAGVVGDNIPAPSESPVNEVIENVSQGSSPHEHVDWKSLEPLDAEVGTSAGLDTGLID